VTVPLEGRLPLRQSLSLPEATSLVTAALLALTAVAGLLFGARGLYTPDPATLPAFLGQAQSRWWRCCLCCCGHCGPPGVARCVAC
jgi:hypothetical protein